MAINKKKVATFTCSVCGSSFQAEVRTNEQRKTCKNECSNIARIRANEQRIKEAGFNSRPPIEIKPVDQPVVVRKRKLTRQQEILNKAKRFAGARW